MVRPRFEPWAGYVTITQATLRGLAIGASLFVIISILTY